VRKTDVNFLRATVCVGFVIGLAACNGTGEQVSPGISLAEDTQAVTPEKEISTAPMNLNEQIEFSKKELAQRLGIEPESITLSGARQVSWRSGALGCPQPGMNYTQALVPGALIFLKVGNEVHGYHAKQGGKPFHCPRERAEQPVLGQGADATWLHFSGPVLLSRSTKVQHCPEPV